MSSSAEVAKRRELVGKLWVRGVPPSEIAIALKASVRTIYTDIESVRVMLQQDRREDLKENRDRSLAVFRVVQKNAWELFYRVRDESLNKSGSLNIVRECEREIARLQGTMTPDIVSTTTVNITQSREWQEAGTILLDALRPFVEARVAAADALMRIEEANNADRT